MRKFPEPQTQRTDQVHQGKHEIVEFLHGRGDKGGTGDSAHRRSSGLRVLWIVGSVGGLRFWLCGPVDGQQ